MLELKPPADHVKSNVKAAENLIQADLEKDKHMEKTISGRDFTAYNIADLAADTVNQNKTDEKAINIEHLKEMVMANPDAARDAVKLLKADPASYTEYNNASVADIKNGAVGELEKDIQALGTHLKASLSNPQDHSDAHLASSKASSAPGQEKLPALHTVGG